MNDIKLRYTAMHRYEQNESPKSIYVSLGKGKTWFFKWLKRFKSGDPNWAHERSRRPRISPQKIDPQMEQNVIAAREQLVNTRYAPIGAQHICWELQDKNHKTPSLATINRIIKRNGLSKKPSRYEAKGVKYPIFPTVNLSNILHQMDGVGPRFLKNDGRFYTINMIDAFDRRVRVNPIRRQNKETFLVVMLRGWHYLGLPNFLQMDNTLATQGSRRHPRSFGLVIRLCLHLGIQPIFIPVREPWRNAFIERFNDDFDKRFFRAHQFRNFNQLLSKATQYELFHDTRHRYSTLGGHTPQQHCTGIQRTLSQAFKMPQSLPIAPGNIHLIRFIRSNRMLDIFGEQFPMPKNLEYEYVRATINTSKTKLFIYHDDQIVKELDYKLPKNTMNLTDMEL